MIEGAIAEWLLREGFVLCRREVLVDLAAEAGYDVAFDRCGGATLSRPVFGDVLPFVPAATPSGSLEHEQ